MDRLLILFPTHHLGNLLIALPHLQAMLQHHPQALLVVNVLYQDLVEPVLGPLAPILYYPGPALAATQPLWPRTRVWLRFVGALRAFRADRCIDLEGESKSALLSLLSGAPRREGPVRRYGRWCYTRQVTAMAPGRHRWEGYARLSDPPAAAPTVALHSRPAGSALRHHLAAWGLPADAPRVVIHPGATKGYKMWPPTHFARLCAALRDAGCVPVLIGQGPRDRLQIENIRTRLAHPVVSLCDQLSLPELAALISQSRGFIGNDSGPLHLAAACGVPVVALFGPTDECCWRPLAAESAVVRARACDPACHRRSCVLGERGCLPSISPERVMHELERLGITRRRESDAAGQPVPAAGEDDYSNAWRSMLLSRRGGAS